MSKKIVSGIFAFLCALVLSLDVYAQFGSSSGVGDALGRLNQSTGASSSTSAGNDYGVDGYYIGRSVGANILSKYKVYTANPALTEYLNEILQAIVVNSPRPEFYNGYHLLILDSPEINGFASSGGHIFITKGLVQIATSEDVLAAVIAHEVAHIQKEHALAIIADMKVYNNLRAIGDMALNEAAAAANLSPAERALMFNDRVNDMVKALTTSGFSKAQEFEADTEALALLAGAGYNPKALSDLLYLMGTKTKLSGNMLSTHPSPAERISNVQKSLSKYRVTDTSAYRSARFKQLVRL
ncbi:M48 family metalloprotease [Breznakiellaceae bacterium SP9]